MSVSPAEGRATCTEHTTDIPCRLCKINRKRRRQGDGVVLRGAPADSRSTPASPGAGDNSASAAVHASAEHASASKRARTLSSVGPELSDANLMHRKSEAARDALVRGVTSMLEALGEDSEREGIRKTPERVCKSMQFLTSGYGQTVEEVVGDALFHEDHHGMVITSCDVFSMCEHHLLPFFGKVHVAYIPRDKIVGLSKIARVVEVYSRRLSVQERLTKQVADAINRVLSPLGVAVVIECVHMCMMARGVQKTTATTTTSSVLGVFAEDPKTRSEFFSHIDSKRLRPFY